MKPATGKGLLSYKYLPKSRGKKISKTKTKICHVFSGIICNKIHVFENLGYKSFFFFILVVFLWEILKNLT